MDKTIGLILIHTTQYIACVYKDIYVKEHGQFGFAAEEFSLCRVDWTRKRPPRRSSVGPLMQRVHRGGATLPARGF